MSGGQFSSLRIGMIADEINEVLRLAETGSPNEYGSFYDYSDDILERFRECVATLRRAEQMVKCIDYLYCGDHRPEDLHKNWPTDVPPASTGENP